MKLIIRAALALTMLCFACAEIKTPQTAVVPEPSAAIEETAMPVSEAAPQVAETSPTESTDRESLPYEPVSAGPESAQSQLIETQEVAVSEVIASAKTGGSEEIPTAVDHAKTGYTGEEAPSAPQPTPESVEPADLQTAVDVACAYAVNTYGVAIDSSLCLDNSAYRFPAVVPDTVSQETLNAKAIDMVEFTFQQLMRVDGLRLQDFAELGIRCNVCCCREGGEILTYVFYDG